MNRTENLERDLTMWLADTATPRVPDFTDDILWVTARTRQRPRWSFAQRWLPVGLVTFGRRTLRPLPWRTLGLLAALALLLVAAAAFYVGSQPRLPPSIGLAAPGLVAYAVGGDIYTVDPVTGAREAIVPGPNNDREPRWSLDGTRIAFLRSLGIGEALVVFDVQRRVVVTTTARLFRVDTDSIAWSPDNRSISINGAAGQSEGLFVIDAGTGALTHQDVIYQGLDVHWRPPDGRQILFLGGVGSDVALYTVDVDDGTVTEIARPVRRDAWLRPSGWAPDGRRVVFLREEADGRIATHVLDLTTGTDVIFDDISFGHVSNDGRRLLALNASGRPCVAAIDGGPCVQIGLPGQTYDGTYAAGAQWAPDDSWILLRALDDGRVILVDPDGDTVVQPPWIALGAESIQRVAP